MTKVSPRDVEWTNACGRAVLLNLREPICSLGGFSAGTAPFVVRASTRGGLGEGVRAMMLFVIALALLVWFVGADQLTRSGFYQEHVVWMRPVGWLVGVLWLTVLLRSRRMALVLVATPAWWLIALQAYRALGGAVLLMAWALGRAPAAIALPTGIGDGLVGLLALPVAVYLCSGRRGGATIAIAWNVLGLADFAIGFGIGTFVPFGLIYPAVMIPAFLAPLSVVFHGLSIRQINRAAGGRVGKNLLGSAGEATPHAATIV
jgi:hypothetical protein